MSVAPARDFPELLEPFLRQNRQAGGSRTELSRIISSRVLPALPALVVAAGGVLAVAASALVFPLLSENNDEAIYLLQADALRHGHLFPPAPSSWRSFLPALSVWNDGRFVPKYTPVHAGIIALGDLLTGSPRGALAFTGMGAALSSYLLGRQVLETRRRAVFASLFFVFSPLTLVQSGTYLAYLSALALLQGFAAALLAGTRKGSRPLFWLSGFSLGAAAFSRPYEALLFAAPLGIWLLWTHRRAYSRLVRAACWIGAGAALPAVAMLAFFHLSTGSWLDSPFNLPHPSDTIGFGSRQMYAGSRPTVYTPALAWLGMAGHTKLIAVWCFGGPALVGLAIAGLKRMNPAHPALWLGLIGVTIPAGYFFFWGSFGSIRWGAPFRLGPFYYFPMLAPMTVLAAAGFDRLWEKSRKLATLTLAGMFAFSGGTLAGAVGDNAPYTGARRALYGPLVDERLDRAIVFLPRLTGSSLLTHPFALARNDAGFSGDVLWALDMGREANRQVLKDFPGRTPYRLRAVGEWRRPDRGGPGRDFRTYLERLPDEGMAIAGVEPRSTGAGKGPPAPGL